MTPRSAVRQAFADPKEAAEAAERRRALDTVRQWRNTLVLEYRHPPSKRPVVLTSDAPAKEVQRRLPLLPINTLRNAALNRVRTRYVLPIDADFLPTAMLYEDLVAAMDRLRALDLFALVIPQFEVVECNGARNTSAYRIRRDEDYPSTFSQCLTARRQGLIRPFHAPMHQIFSPTLRQELKVPKNSGCPGSLPPMNDNPSGVRLTSYQSWLQGSINGVEVCVAEGPSQACSRTYGPSSLSVVEGWWGSRRGRE